VIFWDTETWAIEPRLKAPPLVVLAAACDHRTPPLVPEIAPIVPDLFRWEDPRLPQIIVRILNEPSCGHYVAFDMTVIAANYPDRIRWIFEAYRRGLVHDTGNRQKLLEISSGDRHDHAQYALDEVASRTTREIKDPNDPWRLRYRELHHVPLESWPEEAKAYPRKDVTILPGIFAWQAELNARSIAAGQGDLLVDEHRQNRADFALALMSAYGLEVEQSRVDALESFIHADHQAFQKYLISAGLVSYKRKRDQKLADAGLPVPDDATKRNMNLAKEIMAQVYPDCPRTDPSDTFPEGQYKIDATTCAESNHPWLIALGRYGELNAVVSKDIPMLREGIIHSRYEVCMNTGRTSSSSPNVQNLKVVQYGKKDAKRRPVGPQHGIRECFRPSPGYVYISADYSGLELATWGRVCLDMFGFSTMAEMLIAGMDPHTNFGATVLGIPYDDALARKKDEDPEFHDYRQTGKVFNFGKPGGLGARTLVMQARTLYDVELTEPRARQLGDVWIRSYREARPYFDMMKRLTAGERGRLCQIRSGRWRGGMRFTQACNTTFQGLGADVAKDALFQVSEECYVWKETRFTDAVRWRSCTMRSLPKRRSPMPRKQPSASASSWSRRPSRG
jgi:hypothetical protein